MNTIINVAIVGCGYIGKRHAAVITNNPDTKLVALADQKSPDMLNLGQYSNVPFFHSLDGMLQSGLDIDVVVIATPNGLHAGQALKCLNARKHVVIEKPLALTKADAEKIIFKALQVNRHVFAVMQNRYSPPSEWLKKMVDSGVLGKIYMVQINCYWNRDARYYHSDTWHGNLHLDGGTLYTQFSHFLDILYWVFGDIQHIQSRLKSFNHAHLTDFEDSGIISFELCDGGIGSFNFSTSVWDRNLESSMTVIAENGSIKVGGQYMNEVEHCHVKGYVLEELEPTNPANDYGAYKGSASNHHYIVENVVNVLHGFEPITTNALEGLKVVEIIEQMYKHDQVPGTQANRWRSKQLHEQKTFDMGEGRLRQAAVVNI